MLRYQLARQAFGNDNIQLDYSDYYVNDYASDNTKILVELVCSDVSFVDNGDMLTSTWALGYFNEAIDSYDYVGDTAGFYVEAVNRLNQSVLFVDDKYKTLPLSAIRAKVNDNNITWVIEFETTHFFPTTGTSDIYLYYDIDKYVHLEHGECPNCYQFLWTYDASVENASELSDLLFGEIISSVGTVNGNLNGIRCLRDQIRWSIDGTQEPPTVTVNKYVVNIKLPISVKQYTDLYSEGNIKEYFVDYEEKKAINSPVEMEKYVYTPVTVKSIDHGHPVFEDCMKINFNLHFRVHNGNDWTVYDSDSWNFEEYGDNDNWLDNKYYSYCPRHSSDEEWKRSCQSDLLGYLGFTTNDVKYQKNKLKKSFLRLFYYDSPNQGSQKLLGYSTVFVDVNKLYSKFISKLNFNCYYDDNGDIVKGIKVNREVSVNDLARIIGTSNLTTEEIEEYRLSSQLSVMNKFVSNNSSEGFYLYMWDNTENKTAPMDLYLKVEFNHAGYGRTIPMMAPYRDSSTNRGFKTNNEIINDWTLPNTGYGIVKYNRYSYIHLKSKYDINTNRRIYYLDPDTYGIAKDGNIININLYEARITF